MRLALALGLAIIATVHNAGASGQKATPEVRTLSGEWTFSAEGYSWRAGMCRPLFFILRVTHC
jgi:hypothetical protein